MTPRPRLRRVRLGPERVDGERRVLAMLNHVNGYNRPSAAAGRQVLTDVAGHNNFGIFLRNRCLISGLRFARHH